MNRLDAPMPEKLPPGISRRKDGKLLAQVYSKRDRKRISKVFGPREVAAAKMWRRDTQVALDKGTITAGESPTFRRAAEVFMDGIRDGSIRTRSRKRYKGSTILRYQQALDDQLLDALGSFRLNEIRPGHFERLIGQLHAKLAANSVRNAIVPAKAIYRWAVRQELTVVNPTLNVDLPLGDGRRQRFATVEEARLLLATLEPKDRPLWGTAFYAGLRRGELMALRWSEVDLASGVIRVERNYEPKLGIVDLPKSDASRRKVPIPGSLRELLLDHKMRRKGKQPLAFARSTLAGRSRSKDGPFADSSINQRAGKRWEAQGLESIGLHECRHTYASLMIAAGVSAKALQTYMGHSSITTTYDLYGHLMPDNEKAAAEQLQAFLDAKTATKTATTEDEIGSVEPESVDYA